MKQNILLSVKTCEILIAGLILKLSVEGADVKRSFL